MNDRTANGETANQEPRLAPGHHLFPERSGGWCLLRPDGVFVRLRVEPESIGRLAEILAGRASITDAEPEIRTLVDRFADQGFLVPDISTSDSSTTEPPSCPRIDVLGENPVADAVASLLADVCRVERRSLEADPSPDARAVIACADWLEDTRFSALDAWSAENDAALQVVYAEGLRFYVGPLALPGNPTIPRYSDARARRLAAADHPGPLEDHWRHLETDRGAQPVRWPDAAGIAALAAATVADVLAFLDQRPLHARGDQVAFDPATFTWRRHPVLPIPRGVLAEAEVLAEAGA